MTMEDRFADIERELAHINETLARSQVTGTASQIRASSFLLVDENGRARAELGIIKDGTRLAIYDESGKTHAALVVTRDGSHIALHDENGEIRALLSVTKEGPVLALLDENGEVVSEAP